MPQWTVSPGEGASICTALQRRRRALLAVLAVATRSGTCMQVVGASGAALLSWSIPQPLVVHFPGAGREPGFSRKRCRVRLSHLAHGRGQVVLSITVPVKKRRNCLSSDTRPCRQARGWRPRGRAHLLQRSAAHAGHTNLQMVSAQGRSTRRFTKSASARTAWLLRQRPAVVH